MKTLPQRGRASVIKNLGRRMSEVEGGEFYVPIGRDVSYIFCTDTVFHELPLHVSADLLVY